MKSRRPLVGLVISLALGIVFQFYFKIPFWIIGTFIFFSIVLSVGLFQHDFLCAIFIFGIFFFLGCLLVENVRHVPESDISHIIRYYRRQDVRIEGLVVSDVEIRDFYNTKKRTFELSVYAFETRWGWRKKTGKILVHVFGDKDIQYGDLLRLHGKIYPAFDFKTDNRFSYKEFLARRGIFVLMSVRKKIPVEILEKEKGRRIKAMAIGLKTYAKNIFQRYLSSGEAALMQAIILGDRYQIPRHIRELFIITGTAHILAISGLHVGIVAFLIFIFLRILPIPVKFRPVLAIIILAFYALLTGARPSVVRATIMAVVFLASFLVEREIDPINSLCLAGLIILGFKPLYLFDVGFQLSFTSVLSILLIFPFFQKRILRCRQVPKALEIIGQSLGVSLAVWVGVSGLIAYYFQIISPITIFANLFVIPCISVVVALGIGLVFFGSFFPVFVAEAFAASLGFSLNMMVLGVFFFSKVPGASFSLPEISVYFIWIFYGFLGIIIFIKFFIQKRIFKRKTSA